MSDSTRKYERTDKASHPHRWAPVRERIMERHVEDENGCWVWQGYIMTGERGGYGSLHVRGKHALAHRAAYEEFVGPIPDGKQVDHLCRNRACVNPEHLEVVTTQENTLRGNSWAGLNRRKTHCKHGHEFTPENTFIGPRSMGRPGVTRWCATCFPGRRNTLPTLAEWEAQQNEGAA